MNIMNWIPAVGPVEDFQLQVSAPCQATKKLRL